LDKQAKISISSKQQNKQLISSFYINTISILTIGTMACPNSR